MTNLKLTDNQVHAMFEILARFEMQMENYSDEEIKDYELTGVIRAANEIRSKILKAGWEISA
jgi:hypothetical protein